MKFGKNELTFHSNTWWTFFKIYMGPNELCITFRIQEEIKLFQIIGMFKPATLR